MQASSPAMSSRQQRPHAELLISRPSYPAGGTVVGTVRIYLPPGGGNGGLPSHVRAYVAGRCRIDPRWHPAKALRGAYGPHPCHSALPDGVEEGAVRQRVGSQRARDTVCFWSTPAVDLLSAPVRPEPAGEGGAGGGRTMRLEHRPLSCTPGGEGEGEREREGGGGSASGGEAAGHGGDGSGRQLCYTFRAELPADGPPSSTARSARYFYSAVVSVGGFGGGGRKGAEDFLPVVLQAPFTVVAPPTAAEAGDDGDGENGADRVRTGKISAMAHPGSLPSRVPPSELIRPARIAAAGGGGLGLGLRGRGGPGDVRSLRVADQDGAPCCVLTLVGLRTMRPGSAGIVSFDFSEDVVLGGGDGDGPLLPCYRVSVTLGAEEVAYDATSSASRRIRALTLSEDSADVEPGCTDSVSLTVRLPLDAPVTLSTDLVGVRTECRIEMLVRRPEMASEDVLALEVPCRVVGDGVEEEERVEVEEGGGYREDGELDGDVGSRWRERFDSRGVLGDLRMLSLRMAEAP